MTKPDRWTRLSARIADAYPCNSANTDALIRDIVVILRREHAATVREVKGMIVMKKAETACIDDGYCERDLNRPAEVNSIQREIQTLNDVLAWLEARKK